MNAAIDRIFVDYDGTITDLDTFDVLARTFAGPGDWERLEARLYDRSMTLRDVLAAQASFVTCTLDEAERIIERSATIDPSFEHFVKDCAANGIEVTILSSGVAPLIERALRRRGLAHVQLIANEVDVNANGWKMRFRDESANGHDKAAAVRLARERGGRVAYAGDGYSDFEAALAADLRFAKRGRALEQHLRERHVAFTPFSDFKELGSKLFG